MPKETARGLLEGLGHGPAQDEEKEEKEKAEDGAGQGKTERPHEEFPRELAREKSGERGEHGPKRETVRRGEGCGRGDGGKRRGGG